MISALLEGRRGRRDSNADTGTALEPVIPQHDDPADLRAAEAGDIGRLGAGMSACAVRRNSSTSATFDFVQQRETMATGSVWLYRAYLHADAPVNLFELNIPG